MQPVLPSTGGDQIDDTVSIPDIVRLCRRKRMDERAAAAFLSRQPVDIRTRVAVLAQLTGHDYA